MNKEELQKKCAGLIGVSTSEKELAFEVLQEKVLEQLKNDGDALRINSLGVFQYKINKEENTRELIFSPMQSSSGSKTLFLRLPVKNTAQDDDNVIEDIFSLSVGKPTVPLSSYETGGDSDSSFVIIKKRIEERVNEILTDAQLLSNFNLWDDYLSSIKKGEQKGKSESESSSLLKDLSEPDPEPEEEELDPFTKSNLTTETELYSYPPEEEKKKEEAPEYFSDYETFKNLMEEDDTEEDAEDILGDDQPDEDMIEKETETNGIYIPEEIKKETPLPEIDEELTKGLSEEEIFDLEKTVFNSSFEEGDKVDWNWGDELKSKIPDEEPKVVKKTKIVEEEEKEKEPKDPEEKINEDPFGTLEKTLADDPEFSTLTGEYDDDRVEEKDDDYRITNLSKPREVPPKPKTRITRLTTPVQEPEQKFTSTEEEEKKEVYRSFRERNSNSNIFVIAGIIVILVVIIYFAFSMGDEPSKELVQPSNQTAQTQTDENIVMDEQAVPTPVQDNSQNNVSSNESVSKQPDNSSAVEEIRISNLIFRRGNEYNVQVSSWRSSVKANAEVQRLKARGYKAFVVQAYLPSKGGTWHRVRIGGFKSEEEARNFLNSTQL